MIHHTITRSASIHVTTGKCGFKSHFLHLVFIEIYLFIFNSYDIVMTGYMHYNVSFMCPERLCIFYKVIFIIYLPLKSLQSRTDSELGISALLPTRAAVHAER